MINSLVLGLSLNEISLGKPWSKLNIESAYSISQCSTFLNQRSKQWSWLLTFNVVAPRFELFKDGDLFSVGWKILLFELLSKQRHIRDFLIITECKPSHLRFWGSSRACRSEWWKRRCLTHWPVCRCAASHFCGWTLAMPTSSLLLGCWGYSARSRSCGNCGPWWAAGHHSSPL